MGEKISVRCPRCRLVQYLTAAKRCPRCWFAGVTVLLSVDPPTAEVQSATVPTGVVNFPEALRY